MIFSFGIRHVLHTDIIKEEYNNNDDDDNSNEKLKRDASRMHDQCCGCMRNGALIYKHIYIIIYTFVYCPYQWRCI